jgi:hypothetical protein
MAVLLQTALIFAPHGQANRRISAYNRPAPRLHARATTPLHLVEHQPMNTSDEVGQDNLRSIPYARQTGPSNTSHHFGRFVYGSAPCLLVSGKHPASTSRAKLIKMGNPLARLCRILIIATIAPTPQATRAFGCIITRKGAPRDAFSECSGVNRL